ncbi:MAG: hypothetical protein RLZZ447_1669 [Verrucomicrobiota bacterium]
MTSYASSPAYLPSVSPRRLRGLWLLLCFALGATGPLGAQIQMSGNFAYESNGLTVSFGVARIDNFRPLGTVSGPLSISLWATLAPYSGGVLTGFNIAEVQLGTLLGGYYLSPVIRTTTLKNLPPPGFYNIVFEVSEWTGLQWLIRDYGNFPTYQAIGFVPIPPSISRQPQALTLTPGGSGSLSVDGTGLPLPLYQWFKGGAPLAGQTNATLTFTNAQAGDAGSYTVRLTNGAGSVTSAAAIVTVSVPAVAPVITTQPATQIAIAGSSVRFSVTAASSAALTYTWSRNGAPIAGATGSSLSLSGVSKTDEGNYAVMITNSAGSVTSNPAGLRVLPASNLANLSVRTTLSPNQTLTLGAVVSGGEKDILIRAAGPVLSNFGLTGLPDPRLELYTGGTAPVAVNDDWAPALATTFASVGAFAFPAGSKDAALINPANGAFTVQAKGAGEGTILVEAYDVRSGTERRLVNLSARNFVGTGSDILIAGFAIAGNGTKQVLIRAVGPALTAFGVPGALADPRLEVFDGTGRSLAVNDNWGTAVGSATLATAATFGAVGAFPLTAGSRDAALLLTLNAGASYTVQVAGVNNATGEALVEVYEVF